MMRIVSSLTKIVPNSGYLREFLVFSKLCQITFYLRSLKESPLHRKGQIAKKNVKVLSSSLLSLCRLTQWVEQLNTKSSYQKTAVGYECWPTMRFTYLDRH